MFANRVVKVYRPPLGLPSGRHLEVVFDVGSTLRAIFAPLTYGST